MSAASLGGRRAPRRSKRLSHNHDSELDSSMEHEQRHSAKKRKDAAAAQQHNTQQQQQQQHRRPLGDLTNTAHLPSSNNSNRVHSTQAPHNHRIKELYSSTSCLTSTAAPVTKVELYHSQVDDECDADVSLDDMVDAPGMDTTDEEDKDDEEADSSELDGSLDEEELLFSANKQRARHQRDIEERKEGAVIPPPPLNTSAFNSTTLISLTPALSSEKQLPAPAHAPLSALSALLPPPPPSSFFAPPSHDPLPFHSCMANYAPELLSYLLTSDARRVANPRYMTAVQHDLSFAMRSILVDWLLEVSVEYGLQPHTLLLCVSYIDRFLSVRAIDRTRLQLLGVTALLVAAKYWEIRPPLIDDFLYISDHTYTRDEVVAMERAMLYELRWEIGGCTALDFTRFLLWELGPVDPLTEHMAHLLIDLWLLEQDSVGTRQAVVGGSCLVAAVWAVTGQRWIGMGRVVRFGLRETEWCVDSMLRAWRRLKAADEQAELEVEAGGANAAVASLLSLKGVRSKYGRPQYGAVARLPVRLGSPFDM